MSACPVPNCSGHVPSKSVFCTDHYFRLPRGYTSLINKMRFRAERAETIEDKQHFEGQLNGYVAICVRTLQDQPVVHQTPVYQDRAVRP